MIKKIQVTSKGKRKYPKGLNFSTGSYLCNLFLARCQLIVAPKNQSWPSGLWFFLAQGGLIYFVDKYLTELLRLIFNFDTNEERLYHLL